MKNLKQALRPRLSSIKEDGVPRAEAMIRQRVEGQEAAVRTAREFPAADKPTADLLTQRMQGHEKMPGCCAVFSRFESSAGHKKTGLSPVFL